MSKEHTNDTPLNVVPFPRREEPRPVSCESCWEFEIFTSLFFVYGDGSYRCSHCGTAYEFEEEAE